MTAITVTEILQISFAGIAFLLAFLAYRLLRTQMARETPDPKMLNSLTTYMVFAFGMAVVAIGAQLVDKLTTNKLPQEFEERIRLVEKDIEKANAAVSHVQTRVSGIRLQFTPVQNSPGYSCGQTQAAQGTTPTVMYGLRDGTSCKVPNVNYYKEINLVVPK